jgi:proteic killer suppression protein
MRVAFKTEKLRRQCEVFRIGSRTWGPQVMTKIGQRLGELQAAENLGVLRTLAPGARPHPLERDYRGQYAVSLHGAYRMRFAPANDPEQYETQNGPDLRKVTAVVVLGVEDYHD